MTSTLKLVVKLRTVDGWSWDKIKFHLITREKLTVSLSVWLIEKARGF